MDYTDDGDLRVNATAASVRRQVEHQLRRAIVQGRFAPGDHLPDRVLQDTFQVSRTVVREAVRQLEAEGLIETVPHRGSFVKVMSVKEAEQIYAVRGVLEALAAKEFAKNASDAQIEDLDRVLGEIRKHLKSPAGSDLIRLKQEFYEVLLNGCGNTHAHKMLNQILNRNTQLRATSLSDPERLQHTVTELEVLLRAVRARDEDAAWAASLEHVRNAAQVAIRLLKERNSRYTEKK